MPHGAGFRISFGSRSPPPTPEARMADKCLFCGSDGRFTHVCHNGVLLRPEDTATVTGEMARLRNELSQCQAMFSAADNAGRLLQEERDQLRSDLARCQRDLTECADRRDWYAFQL